jgi:hypothetical protein
MQRTSTVLLAFGLIAFWPNSTSFGVDASTPATDEIYWRFERGIDNQPLKETADEGGRHMARAKGKPPILTGEVSTAMIQGTNQANVGSVKMDGGFYQVTSTPEVDARPFTIEMWVKFGPTPVQAQVLIAKGIQGWGLWHIVYQNDGMVCASLSKGASAYLFDARSGPPLPGSWYHLAVVFEPRPEGKVMITTYVSGMPRGCQISPIQPDETATDLFIGSFTNGAMPFLGSLDEVRFTPAVLDPGQMLVGGTQSVVAEVKSHDPVFVPAGTRIDEQLRRRTAGAPILAEADGYDYFYTVSLGDAVRVTPAAGFDPAFGSALQGWGLLNWATLAGYHFAVRPGGSFLVAIGFYDPDTRPGDRPQRVVLDGREVDKLDVAADGQGRPFVRVYPASDENGDGFLQVSVVNQGISTSFPARMNIVWIFKGIDPAELDPAILARGEAPIPALYKVSAGRDENIPGHITYPPLSAEHRTLLKPLRPTLFNDPEWPRPADPIDLHIEGDLADRVLTFLDRFGFAGRDQGFFSGFDSTYGLDSFARHLQVMRQLERLMHVDLSLDKELDHIISYQDRDSSTPGSFVIGPMRVTGYFWEEGMLLHSLLEDYSMTGDSRALESARMLGDWWLRWLELGDLEALRYIAGEERFEHVPGGVGHIGKGAIESLVWLYWVTRDDRYLNCAKAVAEMNRKWGGVVWMIRGDILNERPELEGWHVHCNLTALRGFPWLYAATGDRTYLEDAIRGSERVAERAGWGTGAVLERIPWFNRSGDTNDETCGTSDLIQLNLTLGDATGEGRFYDRAWHAYANQLRCVQWHNGSFNGCYRIPGQRRGGNAWFCCGFRGAQALYEIARHLYASNSNTVVVNEYVASSAILHLQGGDVNVRTEADIPRGGRVRLTVSPERPFAFVLRLRVPGWSKLNSVSLVSQAKTEGLTDLQVSDTGYLTLDRQWLPGDQVEIDFSLPLRVLLDSSWDGQPTSEVVVDGQPMTETRRIMILRGPYILAQFALAGGCNLDWVYSGDHPELPDTLNSVNDIIETDSWRFESTQAPYPTLVTHTPDGVLVEWFYTPHEAGVTDLWTLKRTALVRPTVPVQIDFTAELIAPSEKDAMRVKTLQLSGIRMRVAGHSEYTPAAVAIAGQPLPPQQLGDSVQPPGSVELDNGYVKFLVDSHGPWRLVQTQAYTGIYGVPEREGRRWLAQTTLRVDGLSKFALPMIGRKCMNEGMALDTESGMQ